MPPSRLSMNCCDAHTPLPSRVIHVIPAIPTRPVRPKSGRALAPAGQRLAERHCVAIAD